MLRNGPEYPRKHSKSVWKKGKLQTTIFPDDIFQVPIEVPELYRCAAIDYALDSMPDDSLIKPLIIANRAEVKRMFITEYDEAATMEKFKQEYFAQGLSQGISQGDRERMESDARGMFKKGITLETIAEILDISVEDVEKMLT